MTNNLFCSFQIPKIVYRELLQNSGMLFSAVRHGISRELFEKRFNIFSPENVFRSMLTQVNSSDVSFTESETFGFSHLIDLSPAEVAFLATGSYMERLLFTIMRWDRKYVDGMLDMFMEAESDDSICRQLGEDKVRAVTRMLLLPTKSEKAFLRRRFATGPSDEALVLSHQDRLLSNIRLLHSAHSFIPTTRAPPVSVYLVTRCFFLYCRKDKLILTAFSALFFILLGR